MGKERWWLDFAIGSMVLVETANRGWCKGKVLYYQGCNTKEKPVAVHVWIPDTWKNPIAQHEAVSDPTKIKMI